LPQRIAVTFPVPAPGTDDRGRPMEYMGLGALLALWRYFFDIDWDVRVKRRKRRKRIGRT